MLYWVYFIKRYVEQFLMFPFILVGKWKAGRCPLNEDYDIFFFFPGYSIGGAERVNAEIIKSFPDKKVIVFFTKKSPNEGMKHFFKMPNVTLKEISFWTDNKFKYWNSFIYRGICSAYINRQKPKPVVFIGQCNFGYKITPHIKRDIEIYELIHMLDERFTWVWAPFIKFITKRVVVADYFKKAFSDYYKTIGIPDRYAQRISVIRYCLEKIPEDYQSRSFSLPLKIYYAGRGGPQKRIPIIIDIIKRCEEQLLPVVFKLAGSFKEEVPQKLIDQKYYIGEIKGGEDMYAFHRQNDVLLMTSAWEGFPIVMMEAMVYGSVTLATDVGAIPEFIKDSVNGFLLEDNLNEDTIAEEAVDKITYMCQNIEVLKEISLNGYEYVTSTFSKDEFINSYRALLLPEADT